MDPMTMTTEDLQSGIAELERQLALMETLAGAFPANDEQLIVRHARRKRLEARLADYIAELKIRVVANLLLGVSIAPMVIGDDPEDPHGCNNCGTCANCAGEEAWR